MPVAEPSESNDGDRSPNVAEVCEALERVLRGRSFEQAGRASQFLRFVVEQTLAGNADRLKGYTIGVEVFGRPATFDAQSDPLVRVEAGRLRRRLAEYYATEGAADPVRIDLPRGAYAAAFRNAASPQAEPAAAPPKRTRRRNRTARKTGVLVAFGALVAAVIYLASDDAGQPDATSVMNMPTGPRILVLPFENLSGNADLDYFTDGITEEIMVRLGDFALFVIGSQTSWSYRNANDEPQSAGADVEARYVLTGSVRNTSDRVRISARLVHGVTGEQLWTAAYDENLTVDSLLGIQEKIAQQVGTTIAVPYGPIFDEELARTARKPAGQLATYDCILKYYYYRRTIDPARHADTLACFQRAVVNEPEFADAWAGLALLYLDEYGFGYSPQHTSSNPFERAREAARTAMDIHGESYLANLAMARIRFFSGDAQGFRRTADRVLALEPNNAEAFALIGTLLAVSGDAERALPLVEKAIALSPRPPGLYYLGRAASELRAGNYEQGLSLALRLDAPNWFITPMIVAAAAAQANRPDVAARAAERLLELYPDFPRRARAELAKWQLDQALLDTVLDGLRSAGIDIP
jgi:adenylate cyclase